MKMPLSLKIALLLLIIINVLILGLGFIEESNNKIISGLIGLICTHQIYKGNNIIRIISTLPLIMTAGSAAGTDIKDITYLTITMYCLMTIIFMYAKESNEWFKKINL